MLNYRLGCFERIERFRICISFNSDIKEAWQLLFTLQNIPDFACQQDDRVHDVSKFVHVPILSRKDARYASRCARRHVYDCNAYLWRAMTSWLCWYFESHSHLHRVSNFVLPVLRFFPEKSTRLDCVLTFWKSRQYKVNIRTLLKVYALWSNTTKYSYFSLPRGNYALFCKCEIGNSIYDTSTYDAF